MNDQLNQFFQRFIYQEERLLGHLKLVQQEYSQVKTALAGDLLAKGISQYAGRTAGKYTRRFLSDSRKQNKAQKEAEVDAQHRSIVERIKGHLGSISEYKTNISEPNSRKLVTQIVKAQEGVRIETRVKATLRVLRSLQSKNLIQNEDIPLNKPKEVVIDPGTPFSGYVELRKILTNAKRYVKIIDPYVDSVTLEKLIDAPSSIPLMILTEKTGGSKKERRLLKASIDFKVEKPLLEMRKSSDLHDRFIVTKTECWSIGCSINAIGNKMSLISKLTDGTKKKVESTFDLKWREGKILV